MPFLASRPPWPLAMAMAALPRLADLARTLPEAAVRRVGSAGGDADGDADAEGPRCRVGDVTSATARVTAPSERRRGVAAAR